MARDVGMTQPPPPSSGEGLGEKIVNTISNVIWWFYEHTVPPLSNLIRLGLDRFMEEAEQYYGPLLRGVYDEIEDNPHIPDSYKLVLRKMAYPDSQWALIAVIGGVLAIIPAVIHSLAEPVIQVGVNWVRSRVRSTVPDPGLAVAGYFRKGISESQTKEWFEQLGYPDIIVNGLIDILRERAGVAEWIEGYRRENYTEAELKAELKLRGYRSTEIGLLVDLADRIPGPSDLISMAVREAWRDDVASAWGYDADYPREFGEWMEKQGYSVAWAKKYWRAHWQLPSVTLGMEMLHRGIIDKAEFLDLLKISDIPSVWRNRVEAVSYNPLTRVDVRRMHKLGVLDTDAVYRSYLDLGYTPHDARSMTEFTVKYNLEDEVLLSKADIESGYKLGMLSRSEASSWLQDLGYAKDLISFYLDRIDTQKEQSRVNLQIELYHDLYTHNEITEAETRTALTGLGLVSGEIETRLDIWSLEIQSKIARPSRSTLEKFLQTDVITLAEFKAGMKALGYQKEHITWYQDSVLAKKEQEAREETEKRKKEQEDLRTRKLKTTYQVDRARLDVDLAEIQTAIVESQVALQSRESRYDHELALLETLGSESDIRNRGNVDLARLVAMIGALQADIADRRERIDTIETEITEYRLVSAEAIDPLSEITATRRIQGTQIEIETLQGQIAGLKAESKALQLTTTMGLEGLTTDDVRAQLANLRAEIRTSGSRGELASLEVKGLTLALDYIVGTYSKTVIASAILALADDIRNLEERVTEKRIEIIQYRLGLLDLSTDELQAEINAEIARLTLEKEQQEDIIRKVETRIAGYRNEQGEVRVRVLEELELLGRAKDPTQLEIDYLEDIQSIQERIDRLRVNLSELKEARARLTFDYRKAEV